MSRKNRGPRLGWRALLAPTQNALVCLCLRGKSGPLCLVHTDPDKGRSRTVCNHRVKAGTTPWHALVEAPLRSGEALYLPAGVELCAECRRRRPVLAAVALLFLTEGQ